MKFLRGLAILGILAGIFSLAYLVFLLPKEAPPPKEIPREEEKEGVPTRKITLIIDDIGYSLAPLMELLKIDAPIAFAVLPFVPHCKEAVTVLKAANREYLLHLPMEPKDPRRDPGHGALFINMEEEEIKRRLAEDLEQTPGIVGVNNHMGSAFMEQEDKVALVLRELKKRGLFFIDSRTTAHSRAEDVALKLKMKFASRNLFLDNDQEEEKILTHLITFTGEEKRDAVIIGHPYPATIRALKRAVPLLKTKGIAFVPPSLIVKVREDRENKPRDHYED